MSGYKLFQAERILVAVEGEHAVLGASSADRWINCPGSVAATRNVENPQSRYAAEGTAAHALAEACRDLCVRTRYFCDWRIQVGAFEFAVDEEMEDAVQDFLDYVSGIEGAHFSELRVSYEDWVPWGFGTADDVRVRDGFCAVTDLKYGQGVQVYAQDNAQLKLYALGVYAQLGHLYEFSQFELAICQPRLDHIDTFRISLTDLIMWAVDVVRPAAAATREASARFAAGDWCKFCRIKATCAERAKWAAKQVVGDFVDLDDGLDMLDLAQREPEDARCARVAQITGGQLARLLGVVGAVKAWCQDVERHGYHELLNGQTVGDWKLVEGRSTRQWRLGDADMAPVLTFAGLEPYEKKIITPSAAEKRLGKKNMGALVDYIEKPPGKPKLAPGTDKRHALTIDALGDFKDLDAVDDDNA